MAAAYVMTNLNLCDYVLGAYTYNNYVLGSFTIKGELMDIERRMLGFHQITNPAITKEEEKQISHSFNKIRTTLRNKQPIVPDVSGSLITFVIRVDNTMDKYVFEHKLLLSGLKYQYELQTRFAVLDLNMKMSFGRRIEFSWRYSWHSFFYKLSFPKNDVLQFILTHIAGATPPIVITPMVIPPMLYIGHVQSNAMHEISSALSECDSRHNSMDDHIVKLAKELDLPVPDMNECMFENALGALVTAYATKKINEARANVRAIYAGKAKVRLVTADHELDIKLINLAQPAAKRAKSK